MTLNATRFLSLLLVALTLGMTFCHVMEIPGKLRLDGATWLIVQQNLYVDFGVVGGHRAAVDPADLGGGGAGPPPRAGFPWTVAAGFCVTAGLTVWFAVVAPGNAALSGWTPETLPADWSSSRDRWEISHSVHAALFGLGFGVLVIALLVESPGNASRPRALLARACSAGSGSTQRRASSLSSATTGRACGRRCR